MSVHEGAKRLQTYATRNRFRLTQVIRLAIAERILLISGNIDRWNQGESRRDQRLQSRGYGIRGMEQIVHLVDQRPGDEAVFIAGRGDLPVSQNQSERTAEREEVAHLEVQLVMRIVTANCTISRVKLNNCKSSPC